MAAVSLFWDTNMAAVTSCENTLLAPFLFIILVDYLLLRSTDGDSGVLTCPRKSSRYPAKVLNDLDFADDIALLESSISRAQSQLTRTANAAPMLLLTLDLSSVLPRLSI